MESLAAAAIAQTVLTKVLSNIDFDYSKNLKKLYQEIRKKSRKQEIARPKQIENLNNVYHNEKLVLVLGAGVSIAHGLPNWNTLLQKLLITTFNFEANQSQKESLILAKLFTQIFDPSPLIAARYLREDYQNSSKKF